MIRIDGRHGEGGGQLARYALALAAITGRSLHLYGIRARRPRPGLMAQHLTALEAVARLSGGELTGARLGAVEVGFHPGRIRGGDYAFEVGTAGSIALVLQALLPVAIQAGSPCRLCVGGGTDVKLAPPWDYLRLVFLPWLCRMGLDVKIESVRHGYYPRGGGAACLRVAPAGRPQPLLAETAGPLRVVRGIAHVAHLPRAIAERMAVAAREELSGYVPLEIETRLLGEGEAFGSGGALVLAAETEHSLLGATAVAERGVPAERLGQAAGRALRSELAAGAALDRHAADQLLIYAALAGGRSRLRVAQVSRHAETVLWLVEQFLPVRCRVVPADGLFRIEVDPA